jgi:hypothetical protein
MVPKNPPPDSRNPNIASLRPALTHSSAAMGIAALHPSYELVGVYAFSNTIRPPLIHPDGVHLVASQPM